MQHIPTLLAQHLQAPAKWLQHLNATDRNIVGRNVLRAFGHPVAMCYEMLRVKNRTGAHAQAQHCCTNLAKWLQHHATSTNVAWIFDHFQIWAKSCCNVATYCTQQCCVEMLRSFGRGFMLKIFTIMLIHNAQKILLCFKDAPIMLQYADIEKLW